MLVAGSLVRYAWHTQTVNLYAPLPLRFGPPHGRLCPQVWSGGRLAGPRCRSCLPYACVIGQSRSGPVRTCIEDMRMRTSSVAARSTRPPRSYRVRHQIWELWLPPQERRGLCQAPDTRMWLNAQKVEVETSSVFARKHTVGKLDSLAFQRTNPRLLNPTRRPSGPLDRPDLESKSLCR